MTFPPLPQGIERDQTVHGKLYYTRDQMRKYAMDVLNYTVKIVPDKAPNSPPGLDALFKGLRK